MVLNMKLSANPPKPHMILVRKGTRAWPGTGGMWTGSGMGVGQKTERRTTSCQSAGNKEMTVDGSLFTMSFMEVPKKRLS